MGQELPKAKILPDAQATIGCFIKARQAMNSSSTSLAALFLPLRRHLISSLIIQDCQIQGCLTKASSLKGHGIFFKITVFVLHI